MNLKKKDKRKFIRRNVKYQNVEMNNLDDLHSLEINEEKRAEKKIPEKAETTGKSNLNLKKARILEVESNHRCRIKLEDREIIAILGGRLKQINVDTRTLAAAGDYVKVDVSQEPRIEEIFPRKSVLCRFTEESFQRQVIIASNLDQVVITSSCMDPEISYGLIDRYLCAAEIAEVKPLICVNKIDLVNDLKEIKGQLQYYRNAGINVIMTSCLTGSGIADLKKELIGKDSVFSGHSGAGKSSLINLLQPGLRLDTGIISSSSGKGTHTTTRIRLLEWNFGGFLIDTPGVKTFGLKRSDLDKLAMIFPGFREIAGECKFNNCTHTHEIDCAVKQRVEENLIPLKRYDSYLRIRESLES